MSILESIKVGIIGCGEHALENLIPSLWLSGLATVVATCDLDRTTAARTAARFPGAKAYADFRSLIDSSGAEAIVTAAPPQVHLQVATHALAQGIHVFVEKPPTVKTGELIGLAKAADRSRLVTMVGHNLRHTTASLRMKSIVSSSDFGGPQSMEVRYYASKPRGDRWGLQSPIRSFLLSHVNHAIDLMAFQVSPPETVEAGANAHPNGAVTLAARFDFDNGGLGTLFASTNCPHFSVQATVFGADDAFVTMDSLYGLSGYGLAGDYKRSGRNWIERQLDSGYLHSGYQTELELFLKAICGKATAQPSFADEIPVYRIIDEIETQITAKMPKEEMSVQSE
jgi:predicted dehydrogenase